MARPSKRTPALEAELLQALRLGNTRTAACQYVGIDIDTLERWERRYAEFRGAVERAQAAAEVRVVGHLMAAVDDGDVSAIKFWLERRRYAEWGKREQLDVTVRGYAERLAQETGLDADELVREAERIATAHA